MTQHEGITIGPVSGQDTYVGLGYKHPSKQFELPRDTEDDTAYFVSAMEWLTGLQKPDIFSTGIYETNEEELDAVGKEIAKNKSPFIEVVSHDLRIREVLGHVIEHTLETRIFDLQHMGGHQRNQVLNLISFAVQNEGLNKAIIVSNEPVEPQDSVLRRQGVLYTIPAILSEKQSVLYWAFRSEPDWVRKLASRVALLPGFNDQILRYVDHAIFANSSIPKDESFMADSFRSVAIFDEKLKFYAMDPYVRALLIDDLRTHNRAAYNKAVDVYSTILGVPFEHPALPGFLQGHK